MTKQLICYSLPNTKASTRTMLHKELYGYKDMSNHGKYIYIRQGILQTTESKRITDAVILAQKSQANKIIRLLEKYKAKIYVFDVIEK